MANLCRLLIDSHLALGEHAGRGVYAGDLLTKTCNRNEDSPGPAPKLEGFSTVCASFLDVEAHVGTIAIKRYAIVELADSFDFVAVIRGLGHPAT